MKVFKKNKKFVHSANAVVMQNDTMAHGSGVTDAGEKRVSLKSRLFRNLYQNVKMSQSYRRAGFGAGRQAFVAWKQKREISASNSLGQFHGNILVATGFCGASH